MLKGGNKQCLWSPIHLTSAEKGVHQFSIQGKKKKKKPKPQAFVLIIVLAFFEEIIIQQLDYFAVDVILVAQDFICHVLSDFWLSLPLVSSEQSIRKRI